MARYWTETGCVHDAENGPAVTGYMGLSTGDARPLDKMVDPTSDLGEDISEADAPSCAACGDVILEHPNHRVITWIENGQVATEHFCDEECRLNWDASE